MLVRVDEYLGVSVDPLVEFLIGFLRSTKVDLVGDNEAWLCSTGDDQISQVSVVSLYIALSGAEVQTFLEELQESASSQARHYR